MAVYALGELVPSIDPDAWVHPDAVVIGRVEVGAFTSIWPGAVLRGDHGHISVGARTSVQDGTVIHTTPHLPTSVGDDCVIGHNVHLEGCTVEARSLVGSGAVVLHGAIVRSHSLVGANALVPGGMEVPAGAMALGVPARLREGAVERDHVLPAVESYLEKVKWYRAALRRLD